MKTRKLEMQRWERKWTTRGKVLPTAALLWALLWAPSETFAQNISDVNDGKATTEVVQKDLTSKKIWIKSDWLKVKWEDLPWIEPDSDLLSEDEWIVGEEWTTQIEEKVEKKESPASFTFQSWLWYSVTGWEALWVNRFTWSGKLFKWKLWEISVTWIADLDDPLHTKWSWKLLLWKKLYKGLSLDWDYTFSGTWDNVMRFGMWYGGKLWDGSYGVKIFPLNTNWSPMSAKVSFSTKVWKNWSLSSFVFVDFDTKWYYSETEYIHQLAQWVAAFVQARLMWTMDGKFTGADGQILMWWLSINL